MQGRLVVRNISAIRNIYWTSSALIFGSSIAMQLPVTAQIATGLMTAYTICDRMDFVNFSTIHNPEAREALLTTRLRTLLLSSPEFADCEKTLSLGTPRIRYGDQGFLGLFWDSLRLIRWEWQVKFALDLNFDVGIGKRSGSIFCDGVYFGKGQNHFTKIRVVQNEPERKKFDVKLQ